MKHNKGVSEESFKETLLLNKKRQEPKERVNARLVNAEDHTEATWVSFKSKH